MHPCKARQWLPTLVYFVLIVICRQFVNSAAVIIVAYYDYVSRCERYSRYVCKAEYNINFGVVIDACGRTSVYKCMLRLYHAVMHCILYINNARMTYLALIYA